MPPGQTHQPWRERLRVPGYHDDSAYDNHPAIAVSWWSAWAFAAWDAGSLPTSLEWEAAARGQDRRLFPWGDNIDLNAVNCADTWAGQPLITYEAWRAELSTGRLKEALPGPVDAHPRNVSPFGIREMVGNVWELTATLLPSVNEAVICGGSFDNPYRRPDLIQRQLPPPRCQQCRRPPLRQGHLVSSSTPRPESAPSSIKIGQSFGRVTDRHASASGPGGRQGTYYVRDDKAGVTSWFSYAEIVTEGFRTIRTGERIRYLTDQADPTHATYVIRLDLSDIQDYYS
jgi:Sulfatase-modifying factor enzyme 1